MLSLIVTDTSSSKRKRIPLSKSPFAVGRSQENDLILPDKVVSGRHCQLTTDGQDVQVQDLDSKAGTTLNGRRIDTRAPLRPGDRVQIGKYRIELLSDRESAVAEPEKAAKTSTVLALRPSSSAKSRGTSTDAGTELRRRVHAKLQTHPELVKMDFAATPAEEIHQTTKTIIRQLVERETGSENADETLTAELLNEALGYGPLEDLLADETVDEIMVNNYDTIYVERRGKIEKTDKSFTDDDQLMNILRRILAPIGRRIDESSPMVDARLPDGSRVNAIIPPLSLIGPVITVRKFPVRRFSAHDLIRRGTLTENMAVFLQLAVKYRRNILISGGTGSGKTTLLNVLSSFIPEDERIVTIEDAAELRLNQPHVLPLEAKPPNIEGKGDIPVRKLLINSLRMRPDRIVIGECRGGEALDMLQAMNTGHDGSLTTLHANSARDALSRLETLVLMAGMDLPVRAIRDQIASAIHLLIQQSRLTDGSRKVVSVSEITGREGDTIVLQDIFRFHVTGTDSEGRVLGEHRPVGTVPKFAHDLRERGIPVDLNLFSA
jgi:pilus assembly protein CpaF